MKEKPNYYQLYMNHSHSFFRSMHISITVFLYTIGPERNVSEREIKFFAHNSMKNITKSVENDDDDDVKKNKQQP